AVRHSIARGSGAIAGAPNAWELHVAREEWRQAMENIAAGGGRLISLWASRSTATENLVRAAFAADAGVLVLTLRLTESDYPGLEQSFPNAGRMQRAITDLCGLRSTNADQRPWLRHTAWPASFHPLSAAAISKQTSAPAIDDYAFVQVE